MVTNFGNKSADLERVKQWCKTDEYLAFVEWYQPYCEAYEAGDDRCSLHSDFLHEALIESAYGMAVVLMAGMEELDFRTVEDCITAYLAVHPARRLLADGPKPAEPIYDTLLPKAQEYFKEGLGRFVCRMIEKDDAETIRLLLRDEIITPNYACEGHCDRLLSEAVHCNATKVIELLFATDGVDTFDIDMQGRVVFAGFGDHERGTKHIKPETVQLIRAASRKMRALACEARMKRSTRMNELLGKLEGIVKRHVSKS